MYSKTVLPTGLRLVSIPMPAVKTATALIMVEAGSRYETARINGISHFLEHMIFKGTKNRPNSLAISSLIDGIGGSFNAFTSKEYTGFYVKAESAHLPLVLDVLSDMLLNSLYNPEELNRERGVIIEEINMYEDQPQARVGEYFEELLYDNHPLARQVVGTKEVIEKVSRQDMVDYVKKMYHSKAIVVGLAGDIASSSKLAEKYFDNVPKGNENEYLAVEENQTKPGSLVHYKKTDQAHMCVGVRAYDMNHPDRYVVEVLATILGGNMSSRMFIEVREKRGLAYYVHTDNEEFHDAGYLMTQAGIRLNNVDEAVKVILEQYGKIRDIKVKEEELKRAKDYAKGKMALALEDSFRVASFYTSQELLRKEIETPEEVLKKIEAVTAEDIQRVAKDIFVNQKLNLAIIGPFEDSKRFDLLLKL
ncbi:insulinase family protein [Patescibacteria group bacterium]|nr:insulinase family protein [Patescibacteria group bacterium]